MRGLLVLKIGGSLYEAGTLLPVLELLLQRQRPLIVVPGGGPFADLVRRQQVEHAFSDAVAHRLALLSMHQMAHVIADAAPGFAPAETPQDFAHILAGGLIPVWLPEPMAGSAANVPQSWEMTSDGLSAWLAAELGAAEVCLVKSCPIPAGAPLSALAGAAIVDREFAALVSRHGLVWSVLEAGDTEGLRKRISGPPGPPLDPH